MSLAKKRRKRLRRRFGKVLLFFFGLIAMVLLWRAPFWNYQGQVFVQGNRLVSAERIRAYTEFLPGALFRIDPNVVKSRIEQIPEIESATVRRWLFPARLEIRVVERHPFAQIATGSTFLDLAGVPFHAPLQTTPVQVLMDAGDLKALDTFRKVVAHWPRDTRGFIDLRQGDDIRLVVGGLVARFGKGEDIEAKFKSLFRLVPLAKRYGKRLEYVDLRYPDSPTLKCKPACKETGNSPSPSSPSP